MGYDHWLYKAKKGAGPITTWKSDNFEGLGSWPFLIKKIEDICDVTQDRVVEMQQGIWGDSVTGKGNNEVIPRFSEHGELQFITLRGAWREDALHLGKKLRMWIFEPPSGNDIDVKHQS